MLPTDKLPTDKAAVLAGLITILADRLGRDADTIVSSTRLVQDLGLDSLELAEVLMDIEDRFQVRFPEHAPLGELFRIDTVGRFADSLFHLMLLGDPDRRWRSARGQRRTVPRLAEWTQRVDAVDGPEVHSGHPYEPSGTTADGRPVWRRRRDGMVAFAVPPGPFLRGILGRDERPPTMMSGFLLDREPVSVAAYARFLTAISPVPSAVLHEWLVPDIDDQRRGHLPVVATGSGWNAKLHCATLPMWLVSWYGANAYSLWTHGHDWRAYRGDGSVPGPLTALPSAGAPPPAQRLGSFLVSEAEWEYAARGSDHRIWPWGDAAVDDERACLARHRRGRTYAEAGDIDVAPVHELLGVGPFGHHHLCGNVWNWCRDYFIADDAGDGDDPQQVTPTPWRAERGGSWLGPAELGMIGYRRGRPPLARGRCLGFRCAYPL